MKSCVAEGAGETREIEGRLEHNASMRKGKRTSNRENHLITNDLCVAKPVATDRHADPKKNISLVTIELDETVESLSLYGQEQTLSTENKSHLL